MKIDINIRARTPKAIRLLEKIIMNQAELKAALEGVATGLGTVGAQLEKATNEIIVAISNAGNTSPEVDAAVASLQAVAQSLKTAAQGLDDLNPDAPAPAPSPSPAG